MVQSGYANPVKNRFLKEALLSLMKKLIVEKVVVKSSLVFYNRLFLVPKPNKMVYNLGFESVELIPQYQYLQDGNPGDNSVILTGRGMGDIAGLQRRLLPHSNKLKVTEISEVFPVQSNLPIHSSSLWSGHSSPRVYQGGQGSEDYGSSKGYPDPPVPR